MHTLAADRFTLVDFDYELPEELIAQHPSPVRDQSRLMVLDRRTGAVAHRMFADIVDYLRPGDLLVLNNTRVFPCRLAARKPGGGKAEIFLLEELGVNLWRALVRGVKTGNVVAVAPGVEAKVLGSKEDGVWSIQFIGVENIRSLLPEIGSIPLPPYIERNAEPSDCERYQTVYASCDGAVAAPTAGLHFTDELLGRLREKGVDTAMVTLHVGPGTFQPVRTENIDDHHMHPERYEIPFDSAEQINRAIVDGRRIIAVGTTSVRALETAAGENGMIKPGRGSTSLFIRPGYVFKAVDCLITNFHLPKSTLLMLVSAFAGREHILSAYRTAVEARYRFYSYGDAMLIS